VCCRGSLGGPVARTISLTVRGGLSASRTTSFASIFNRPAMGEPRRATATVDGLDFAFDSGALTPGVTRREDTRLAADVPCRGADAARTDKKMVAFGRYRTRKKERSQSASVQSLSRRDATWGMMAMAEGAQADLSGALRGVVGTVVRRRTGCGRASAPEEDS